MSGVETISNSVKILRITSGISELGTVGPLSVTAFITFLRISWSLSIRKIPFPSLLPILPLPSSPGTFTSSDPKL